MFLGVRKDGEGTFAVKVIETLSQDILNDSLNELMNMSVLRNNPNVISFESYRQNHAVLENKNSLYQLFIKMPLATNTLWNILNKQPSLSEELVLDVMGQLLFGLKSAHEKNCAHLDLKPENILFF